MKSKNRFKGKCPLCDRQYTSKNFHTEHHIYYPKDLFCSDIKVDVCVVCHREFNGLFPVRANWDKRKCLLNWLIFCNSKGKNAVEIYPIILEI